METAFDILSWLLLVGGGFFLVVGGTGLLRLPDFYARMHAAGVTDTLGAYLILLGLMVQAGLSLVTVKLVLVGVFLIFTTPTATHAVANAAFVAGLKPRLADAPGTDDRKHDPEEDASSKV